MESHCLAALNAKFFSNLKNKQRCTKADIPTNPIKCPRKIFFTAAERQLKTFQSVKNKEATLVNRIFNNICKIRHECRHAQKQASANPGLCWKNNKLEIPIYCQRRAELKAIVKWGWTAALLKHSWEPDFAISTSFPTRTMSPPEKWKLWLIFRFSWQRPLAVMRIIIVLST